MKRYLPFFLLLFPVSTFGAIDTSTIVEWNNQALDLAYSDPAEGFKLATKALNASRSIHFSRGEVRALLRLGVIYDVQSNNAKAIEMYNQSLVLARKTNDQKGIAANLNNLGLIYLKTNDFKKALAYFNRSYFLFAKLEDYGSLGSISNNIGLIHNELDSDGKALYWYRRAIQNYDKAKDDYAVNDVYSNMGNTYDGMKLFDSARVYINKSIEGYRRTDNKYGLAISLNNLGLLLSGEKNPQAAIPVYEEAMALAKEIGNDHSYVSTGFNLSSAYRETRQFEKRFATLEAIYPLLDKTDSDELGFKVCYELARAYFRKNDFRTGDALMDQYKRFHTNYSDALIDKNIQETEQRFAVKEQQRQSAFRLKQQANARFQDNLIWMSGLAGLLLLGLLAFFIVRKRNLQQELESQKAIFDATTEERKRISYDLHDHVGSQLSYVVNNLELIRHTDRENERIERTFSMSQAAMSSLRDTVWALHTEELTVESLSQRMENVARKTIENAENLRLEFVLRAAGETILPAQVTMHVMRILQEAVHNVVKHAKASVISVTVSEETEGWSIAIADNGKGMQSDESKPFHYGLQSMKDRAAKIGGKLHIASNPNEGTTVTLEWPKE